MTSGRVREFLGVWTPMILGIIVIALSVNFLVSSGSPGPFWPEGYSWDAWRSVCTGGLVLFGVLLFLSTLGRYRKARAARSETPPPEGAGSDPRPPTIK